MTVPYYYCNLLPVPMYYIYYYCLHSLSIPYQIHNNNFCKTWLAKYSRGTVILYLTWRSVVVRYKIIVPTGTYTIRVQLILSIKNRSAIPAMDQWLFQQTQLNPVPFNCTEYQNSKSWVGIRINIYRGGNKSRER